MELIDRIVSSKFKGNSSHVAELTRTLENCSTFEFFDVHQDKHQPSNYYCFKKDHIQAEAPYISIV